MIDARQDTLRTLIAFRRELKAQVAKIDKQINDLSGDKKYRDFVDREEAREVTSTRQVRDYDMPTVDAEKLAQAWGVDFTSDSFGLVPEHLRERIDRLRERAPAE